MNSLILLPCLAEEDGSPLVRTYIQGGSLQQLISDTKSAQELASGSQSPQLLALGYTSSHGCSPTPVAGKDYADKQLAWTFQVL